MNSKLELAVADLYWVPTPAQDDFMFGRELLDMQAIFDVWVGAAKRQQLIRHLRSMGIMCQPGATSPGIVEDISAIVIRRSR